MSRIRANQITNQSADGAPTVQHGLIIAGVSTFTGSVSIGGTLTYEDVTNIDSVGIVTARGGIHIDDSIVHIGDTNTKIRFPTTDTFTVETAGTEKVRITSDGRLLMGVTTSQQGDANLQVFRAATTSRITFGNENVSASGVAGIDFCPSNKVMGSRIECQASEDFSSSANRTADLVFFTRSNGTSSEKLRITSDGKFGIGTQSPNYKTVIQVSDTTAYSASTISANQFQLAISNSGANGVAGILLATEPSSGNGGHCGIRALSTGNGNSDLTFSTRGSSTSAERLRITSGGYVNIGGQSTQSTHLLHLQSTGDTGIHIRADSDNSGENDNPYISMSQDGSSAQLFKIGMVGDSGSEFAQSIGNGCFIHASNNNAQPLMLAHQDNMVAILSNTEQSHFHSTSGNNTGGMKIANRGNDTAAALLLQGHNNTGTPGQATNTQLTHLGANLEFEIKHNGNRAIHVGSTRRIRVPGVWGVNGSSMRTVQIESDGNLCAPSSIREAKINIESISDVSWLYDFNPVTFNFRTKTEVNGENVWGNEADDGGLQYGLIADEVEAVNQDLCFYDDNKLSGVHYDRMIAPLIKALQEQKAEIDLLKTKVATLEGS